MGQTKSFVALVSPWLARPGDRPMHPLVLGVIVGLLVFALAFVGVGVDWAVREALPTREATP